MQDVREAAPEHVTVPAPPGGSSGLRRTLDWTGRVLVVVGLLILLFVAYQLWGTGLVQARSQDRLRDELRSELQGEVAPADTTAPTTGPEPTVTVPAPTTTLPAPPTPANGDPVSSIVIPKLGIDQVVVQGIDVDDLRLGPGHYPATPLPGQEGNVGVAGHRTTYGAPFADIQDLAVGDEIIMRSVQGEFRYRVSEEPFVVSPDDGDVLLGIDDPIAPGRKLATLTLTTCHPKFSAAERLIVRANLDLPPGQVALPPTVDEDAPVAIAGLDGDETSRGPTILWGAIVLAVGGLWWFLFHRWSRWYVWIAGAVPFLVVLFVFYTNLERMLPSSY